MKNIAILGSTGSIGTQTLDVVRKNNDLRVVAVSAGRSVEKLEEQIREFHPLLAAVWDEEAARDLKTRIADTDTKVVSGMEGLLEIGEKFGVLRDVMETGANDVYIVDRVDGEEILLPAIHDCVLDVDVEKNTMTVHLMKGLV